MSKDIGAPGRGISRREFLAATGATGFASLAGCTAPTNRAIEGPRCQMGGGRLPSTSPPEVVNVDERGGSVTLSSVPAQHAVHPLESMGGPVEFPRVWAFKAEGGQPSVPGPILRTTEGEDMEISFDNANGNQPHTLHFHGIQKSWEDDGVPTTTGIQINPGEQHIYTLPANVPGTTSTTATTRLTATSTWGCTPRGVSVLGA